MAASGTLFADAGQSAGNQFWSGVPAILQGLFGNSGRPYEKANQAYQPFYQEAKNAQNPFYNAGTRALPQYQEYLNKMSNPSDFINQIMGSYQQSPWAKYNQQEGIRAAQNLGSATGLTGSTPLLQQTQQNAQNISSQDMNQWLQNVLGINTQYGAGLGGLIQGGQHAGDILSQLASNAGEYAGGTAYGKDAGQQMDRNALWSGIAKMFGG